MIESQAKALKKQKILCGWQGCRLEAGMKKDTLQIEEEIRGYRQGE